MDERRCRLGARWSWIGVPPLVPVVYSLRLGSLASMVGVVRDDQSPGRRNTVVTAFSGSSEYCFGIAYAHDRRRPGPHEMDYSSRHFLAGMRVACVLRRPHMTPCRRTHYCLFALPCRLLCLCCTLRCAAPTFYASMHSGSSQDVPRSKTFASGPAHTLDECSV